ncbi:ABC transporter substrate-binding protein [Methanospirillum lacunae]|uniref:ABC transporter substrate-binding protein n=1 Tax=Methanospirillum lacunae TaxID=668570 RepID=UPI0015E841E0|nr:ABC transporter substrate-binding protein [Methanospirillum lacunae]
MCSYASPTENTNQSGGFSITDLSNREISLPGPVSRITSLNPTPTYMAWRLAPDKMTSIDMVSKALTYMLSPEDQKKVLALPVTGVYFKGLNNEQIISLKPDVVVTLTKDPNIDKEQDTFNIPVAAVDKDTLDSFADSYRFMGKLLGNEKEGDELGDYWDDLIKKVTSQVSTIPESKKLKVYYAGGSPDSTTGSKTIISSVIRDAGGIVYPDAVTLTADPSDETIKVPVEDVLKWNPDVIITHSSNLSSQIKTDSAWKDTSAVKNNRVYSIPKYAIPDGITAAIGLVWAADTLYPEQTQLDYKKEIRDFYQNFLQVSDLTDEQISQEN